MDDIAKAKVSYCLDNNAIPLPTLYKAKLR